MNLYKYKKYTPSDGVESCGNMYKIDVVNDGAVTYKKETIEATRKGATSIMFHDKGILNINYNIENLDIEISYTLSYLKVSALDMSKIICLYGNIELCLKQINYIERDFKHEVDKDEIINNLMLENKINIKLLNNLLKKYNLSETNRNISFYSSDMSKEEKIYLHN